MKLYVKHARNKTLLTSYFLYVHADEWYVCACIYDLPHAGCGTCAWARGRRIEGCAEVAGAFVLEDHAWWAGPKRLVYIVHIHVRIYACMHIWVEQDNGCCLSQLRRPLWKPIVLFAEINSESAGTPLKFWFRETQFEFCLCTVAESEPTIVIQFRTGTLAVMMIRLLPISKDANDDAINTPASYNMPLPPCSLLQHCLFLKNRRCKLSWTELMI
jgi:hypothetical protein